MKLTPKQKISMVVQRSLDLNNLTDDISKLTLPELCKQYGKFIKKCFIIHIIKRRKDLKDTKNKQKNILKIINKYS